MSWIRRTGVILLSRFRFDCSNDWMKTGEVRRFRSFLLSTRTSRRSSASPMLLWKVGCFVSG
jgi:hypothetical protein